MSSLLAICLLLSLVTADVTEAQFMDYFYRHVNKKAYNVTMIPISGSVISCAAQCGLDDLCSGFNAVRADETCELVKREGDLGLTLSSDQIGIDYYAKAGPINLLTIPGVNCTSSSTQGGGYECEKAYDGEMAGGWNREWGSNEESDGVWLEVNFPGIVTVLSIQLWQRCHVYDQYKRYTLRFSDGSEQEIPTQCNGSSDWLECGGVPQVYRRLTRIQTLSVRITGSEECNTDYGFAGIREMNINGWQYD